MTDMLVSVREDNLERHVEVDTANVDEIASIDEDCSMGMKSNGYTSRFLSPRSYIFRYCIKKDALSSFHNEDIMYCIKYTPKECHYLDFLKSKDS